jgi:radical SAM protein with 4Fe4S-binding SPASM domain
MTRRLNILEKKPFPAYVVWELTLKCDQRCSHCGSRASVARAGELDRAAALTVVAELKSLGALEVVLIGGEAYLHHDFIEIAEALVAAGMEVSMTTGGQGMSASLAQSIKEIGIKRVSVSIDGLAKTHDRVRAKKHSFNNAITAIKNLKNAQIIPTVNTTINSLNKSELEELYSLFIGLGVRAWQVQILVPLGRAADRPGLLLEPHDLIDIIPRISRLKEQAFKDGMLIMPGNNLGYFGPEEAELRSMESGGRDYFMGCQAGRFILGIESDGTIKGCPSLQTKDYQAGTVKEESLIKLWEESLALNTLRSDESKELWGFCKSCVFAKTCKGGCTFTAHSLFGRAGNNPYCYHRAKDFARRGLKEKLTLVERAAGLPFDYGRFKIDVVSAT